MSKHLICVQIERRLSTWPLQLAFLSPVIKWKLEPHLIKTVLSEAIKSLHTTSIRAFFAKSFIQFQKKRFGHPHKMGKHLNPLNDFWKVVGGMITFVCFGILDIEKKPLDMFLRIHEYISLNGLIVELVGKKGSVSRKNNILYIIICPSLQFALIGLHSSGDLPEMFRCLFGVARSFSMFYSTSFFEFLDNTTNSWFWNLDELNYLTIRQPF